MTQVESIDDIGPIAAEIRQLWIETAFQEGITIPLPSYPEEYSGKFLVRLPRSLHRQLAEGAECEGVSLNQYVVSLLARRDVQARLERQVEALSRQIETLRQAALPTA